MNLVWVAAAAVVPLVAGMLTSAPLWRRRVRDDMGSIAGVGVVLFFVVTFIAREYGEIVDTEARCVVSGIGCHFHPEPFTRYVIFASIGLVQTFAIFITGLIVDERLRRRER
jgi:hypothetical protein